MGTINTITGESLDLNYDRVIRTTHGNTSPAGDRVRIEYVEDIDKDGKPCIRESGKTDVYALIQSYKAETEIYNILDRFNGDQAALEAFYSSQPATGIYTEIGDTVLLDLTNMPKSPAEAQQAIIRAENMFKGLPLNVREQFNHNPAEWIAQAGTEKWNELMQLKQTDPSVITAKADAVVAKSTEGAVSEQK